MNLLVIAGVLSTEINPVRLRASFRDDANEGEGGENPAKKTIQPGEIFEQEIELGEQEQCRITSLKMTLW